MFKKILCADDLSHRARKVLATALDLARQYGAELVILNVREDFLDKDEMVMLRVDVSEFEADMQQKAMAIRHSIESEIEALGGQDLQVEILLREGKPGKTIPLVAQELGADLIVIGTHGLSFIREKLFGATSEEVIQHAGRSILAVWTGD